MLFDRRSSPCGPDDLVTADRKPSAISRPPAATNGIMYDTPVISTRRTRPPQRLPGAGRDRASPPARGALDARRVGVGGVAHGLGDHRVAVVDGALDAGPHHGLPGEPAPVADPDVGGEDDRAAAAMISRCDGVEPAEPWVSTWMVTPARAAAASRASAAM